jgi:DNA-binding beta-propeller fold protein YncE
LASALAASAALLVLGLIGTAVAAPLGEIGPSLGMTGNGRTLHPTGRLTQLGNFPTGAALSPDGRFLWAVDSGHGKNDVKVTDVATGQVVQTVPLPGGYEGVAFAPDGSRAYVSGTKLSSDKPEGPTKGNGGDVVHVFRVNPATGHSVEENPIALPATSGGTGQMNSLPPASGDIPEGLAVSPNGRWLVVALNQADRVALIDLGPSPGPVTTLTVGRYPAMVAFDAKGRAFVSNEYDGTLSVVDPDGRRVIATIGALGGALGDVNSHPEGMAVDPLHPLLYVAVTNRDLVDVIDTDALKVVHQISVGRPEALGTAPVNLAVAPDGQTLYAADAGEDAVAVISLTQRPGPGVPVTSHTVIRVRDLPSIARYKTLARRATRHLKRALRRAHSAGTRSRARARYRRRLASLQRLYLLGFPLGACQGPTRAQERAYDRAVLRALGRRFRRSRPAMLRQAADALPAIQPCAAEPGYLANLPADSLIGRIPTAAYPTDVKVTPSGDRLLWIAGKGMGSGPNPTYHFDGDKRPMVTPTNQYGTYVLDQFVGLAGALARPTDIATRASLPAADAQVHPSNAQGAPPGTPVVGPDGGPSQQIKHVFYIVKENRTYDQLFGSDRRGDGDPSLELFDDNGVPGPAGGVTPNAHKLTRMFPLLDHFYEDSEVSSDGHTITTGGYATDYDQKSVVNNYSSRGKGQDTGIFPISFPPKDFLFDQAARQGVSFRVYGEGGGGNSPFGNDGRPTFNTVSANTDFTYASNIQIGCLTPAGTVGNLASCAQDSGQFDNTGTPFSATSRMNNFIPKLLAQDAAGQVPTFNYLILPNDHTDGTTPNDPTPQALIADNDLALGQLVDAISHSSIWPQTAIFVVEDDSQDGADHVDSHRSPALVISPWAKRGAVVHTRYDQYSVLRTVELITGLHPLSLNDALATPMYDAFDTTADPNGTGYTAVQPTQSLRELNTARSPSAALSARLPFNRLDAVPQEIFDRILWHSVYGAKSTPPPPGPNGSAIEHQRAVAALRIMRRGGNVRDYLESTVERPARPGR